MSKRDDWREAYQHAEDRTEARPDLGCRADDLKGVLHQLADQIADADRRHSVALQEMHQRLARLGGQTESVKAALPRHLASAFDRIEDGIAQLASSLAETERERQAHAVAAPPVLAPAPAGVETPGAMAPSIDHAAENHMAEPTALPPPTALSLNAAPPALRSAVGLAGMDGWTPKASEPAFEQNPDDPWDQTSAAALTKLYESGEAGLPPAPRDTVPANVVSPLPSDAASPLATDGEHDAGQRAWLDAKLSDIAARVERSLLELRPDSSLAALGERFDHFEQRVATALDGVASRSDVEGLRIVEAHIAELSEQIERTRTQLARLDAIEQQLADLGHAFSDEELTRLLGGMVPTETDLVRFAEDAASRVASRMSGEQPQVQAFDPAVVQKAAEAAQATTSRQMQSLHELLSTYMEERRRGEAQTADALETMQQAMQHMLDRVDAIEQLRSAPLAAYEPPPVPTVASPVGHSLDERPVTSQNRTFAEEAKAAARMAALAAPAGRPETTDRVEPRLEAPIRPPAPRGAVSTEALAAQIAAATPRPVDDHETEIAAGPEAEQAGKPADRQAFIAMARRAAEQAKMDAERTAAAAAPKSKAVPAQAAAASVAAASLKSRLLGPGGGKGATSSRTSMLLVASLGAVLLAGLWTVSGKKLSLMRAAPVAEQVAPPAQQPAAGAPAIDTEATPAKPGATPQEGEGQPARRRSQPETGTDDLGAAPRGSQRQGSLQTPVAQPAVQHVGLGIAIEQPPAQGSGEQVLRARQEQHMASLSQRTALEAARTSPAADATAPARQDGATTIELPPAAIGPLSLRVAAGKGDASAQFDVAVRFAEGRGVKQDFAQAATWYQRAATQGLAQAQYRLAALYERGLGVAADPGRARVWYKRAAEQGNLKAMHNLAVMSTGDGGAGADYVTAAHWFREAAERGLSDSQFNLGVLSESGLGTDQDQLAAFKWFSLAARTGDKEASRRRDVLRAKLDEQQVAAVEADVAAWRQRQTDRMANDPRFVSEAWKQHAKAQ